jgi:hypothetical protein
MKKEKFRLVKKYLSEGILDMLRNLYAPIKYIHYSKGDI